jgi:glycosyltransferase involved in cell wall biosynthesis
MSDLSADRLLEAGVARDRIFVVPYGIDVPAEPPTRPEDSAPIRCIAVGRMVPKKGPLLTIRAFAAAKRRVPELELTVIGSGELLEPARALSRELGVEDHVEFLGNQPMAGVLDRLRDADLFLQHSMVDPKTGDEEGLPIIILQAMAAGLPVVSTNHAGIPTAVDSGATGFLVDEGDVDAMAERIAELASHPERRAEMGRMAWRRARDTFSWGRERSDLLDVLGLSDSAAWSRR